MRIRNSIVPICIIAILLISGQVSAQWQTSVSTDEMTGKKSCYAHSNSIAPVKQMGFPYQDVQAWIGIGSDGGSEWAYIGFSEAPNLADTDIGDGYSTIQTRIKWDDQVENVTLRQEWGAKFLHFEDDERTIAKIAESGTVLLELNWYGEGKTYFKISLSGSSAAIAKIRKGCGSS